METYVDEDGKHMGDGPVLFLAPAAKPDKSASDLAHAGPAQNQQQPLQAPPNIPLRGWQASDGGAIQGPVPNMSVAVFGSTLGEADCLDEDCIAFFINREASNLQSIISDSQRQRTGLVAFGRYRAWASPKTCSVGWVDVKSCVANLMLTYSPSFSSVALAMCVYICMVRTCREVEWFRDVSLSEIGKLHRSFYGRGFSSIKRALKAKVGLVPAAACAAGWREISSSCVCSVATRLIIHIFLVYNSAHGQLAEQFRSKLLEPKHSHFWHASFWDPEDSSALLLPLTESVSRDIDVQWEGSR